MPGDEMTAGNTPQPGIMIFEELPPETKEEVRQHAEHGSLVADPLVRDLSIEWSERITSPRATAGFWIGATVNFVAEFVVGNGTGLVTLTEPFQRRKIAHQIRRASRKPSR